MLPRFPQFQPVFLDLLTKDDRAFILFFVCGRMDFIPPVNWFHKRVGPKAARPFPRFKTLIPILDKVATRHQLIPFQTPEAFRNAGFPGCRIFD